MSNARLPAEASDPALTTMERLVRWVLMVGFLVVLVIEAWLLWQAWVRLF